MRSRRLTSAKSQRKKGSCARRALFIFSVIFSFWIMLQYFTEPQNFRRLLYITRHFGKKRVFWPLFESFLQRKKIFAFIRRQRYDTIVIPLWTMEGRGLSASFFYFCRHEQFFVEKFWSYSQFLRPTVRAVFRSFFDFLRWQRTTSDGIGPA